MNNKYFKYIDIIRILSCFGILLYHLNIIKGGYLAVCTFFVLSGYLSIISAFNKKRFSLKNYYLSRIKKIYLPLIIVTFISITIISKITNYNWINLKPEVTSIIFGYNNFWQLNANLDYFVRNISTPFMHFWYISILLQFEIIFPIVFIIIKKIGKKTNKKIPCIILFIIGIASAITFHTNITNNQVMQSYYNTFSRLFSLVFGMLIGLIHIYYKPLVLRKTSSRKKLFYFYLIILSILFFIVDSESIIWNLSMFLVTLISMRLIDYAVSLKKEKTKRKYLHTFANICYEIYLVQYPVIFIIQDYKMNSILKILSIILITIIVSILIHFSLNKPKKRTLNIIRIIILIPIILLSIHGFYTYLIAKDYTADMNKLKRDLGENKKLIEKKQKESLLKQKEEDEKWQEYLNNSEINEEDLEEKVKNLHVIGIGDSVMELAVKNLYNEFPNGYFDAATNRTEKKSIEVINDLKSKGIDGDIYILNVGTNGLCNEKCKEELLQTIGKDKYIFWVNATNPDYDTFNTTLETVANKHDNVFIIDWRSYGLAHQEYLIYDKVHPNVTGCKIYAQKIYEGIYNKYKEIYSEIRDKKIEEHNTHEKEKNIFIGNDLLRGIYDDIDNNYQNKKILVGDYKYNDIKKIISNESTSNNIILVFDTTSQLTNKEYQKLINTFKEKNISIVTTNNTIKLKNTNIIYYDTTNKTTLDKIHLSTDGNKELSNLIKEKIN